MNEETHKPDAANTASLLKALWERGLPRLHERLHELEAAIAAVRDGRCSTEQREQATATAHKLAGSLGMFGYAEATDAARSLEQMLESGEGDAESLQALYNRLRGSLDL